MKKWLKKIEIVLENYSKMFAAGYGKRAVQS